MQRERINSLELLRVISMFLILTTHFWGHCIDLKSIEPFTNGYIYGWFSKGVSYISVNTFVLVSAYFMCEKSYRSSRLLNLEIQVLFYSISIFCILLFSGNVVFSYRDLLDSILPTLLGEYWFVTVFFGLLFLHPFLNIVIRSMTKRQHLLLCIVLIILFSVIPNIFFFSKWLNFGTGYGIVWFVSLYFFASYVKIHVNIDKIKAHRKLLYGLSVTALFLPFLSRVFIVLGTSAILGHPVGGGLFYGNNTILCLLSTILVFLAFLTFNIKRNKLITFLSSGSFAVYLISDNPHLAPFIWGYVGSHIDLGTNLLPFVVNGWLLVIYFICTLIDYPRQFIHNLLNEKINIIGIKTDRLIKKLSDENTCKYCFD